MDNSTATSATSKQNGLQNWKQSYDADSVSLHLCDLRQKARAIAADIELFETLPRYRSSTPIHPAETA